MLMRIDPLRDFDRMFERVWGGWTTLPMDARRSGETVDIDVDVPGIDPSAIEVTVEKDVLTIKAERPAMSAEGEMILSERPSGSYRRQVFLGRELDGEHLVASYDNGVLHITVPVAESAKPRRIEVGRPTPAIEATSSKEAA